MAACRRLAASNLQQFVQLVDQPLEIIQRRVDRGRLFHVDPRIAQQIERIFRAAALEESRDSRPAPCCPPLITRSDSAIAADRPVAYL